MKFSVTYEIVTPESAEHGEAEESGFVIEGATLRDAVEAFRETRTAHCDGVVCVERCDRWITVRNGMEFQTGAYESRSLHYPDNMTNSSIMRIERLLNA